MKDIQNATPDQRERPGRADRAGRMDPAVMRGALLTVLALGLIGTWTNLVGFSGSFLRSTETSKLFYQFGSLAMALVFLTLPRVVDRLRAALSSAVPTIMSVATVLYGVAFLQDGMDPAALVDICCFLLGACYVWFILTLYALLGRVVSMPVAIAGITVAQIVEQVLASALNAVFADIVLVGACVVLPPAVAAILAVALRAPQADLPRMTYPPATRNYQILLIVVVALASTVMSRVCSVGAWGTARSDYQADNGLLVILVACALLALFAFVSLYKPCGAPLNIRYQPAFLLMVGGCLFMFYTAPLAPIEAFPLKSLDYALEFLGHVTMWVVAVDSSQRLAFHPNRVFGLMLVVGPFIRLLWPSDGASDVAVLLMTYLVVVVVAVLPYINDYLGQRTTVTGPAGTGNSENADTGATLMGAVCNRCIELAAAHGLTDRELEVLELLACGKTRANVQDLLFISESTVKTHIKHIYAKFDVATVTELMDIVFCAGRDAAQNTDQTTGRGFRAL